MLPLIEDNEKPFDIPNSWQWVRLGDLFYSIQYGYTASAIPSGKIKILRISDIQNNSVDWDRVPFCEIEDREIDNYLLKINDILFARTGGTVGKSLLVENLPTRAIFASYLIRTNYHEDLFPHYLKAFMESPFYWTQLKAGTLGTAQPNCNGKKLSKMIIPLPPLAEQKRIVAKLEELMPLIERYDAAEKKLSVLDKEFPDKLRKSILQQAIQGKLTEQLSSDGDARDLLEKIRAEKVKLIADGKIKKEKPLPTIKDDEKPFDIPDSWCWVRLGEIGNYKKGPFGSSLTKDIFVPKGNDAIKVYEQKNAIQKDASLGSYYISKKYFCEKMSGFEIKSGDIIISCAGTIGESYVMPLDMEKGIINQALMRMKIFAPMNVRYFLIFFDFVLKQNAKLSSKGSAIKNIPPLDILKNFLVPLPPPAEQERIVAKLNELLPLCDALSEKIRYY